MKHFTPHTQRPRLDGLEFAKKQKEMFSSTHNVRLARFSIANRFFAEKNKTSKGNERKSPSCSFVLVETVAAVFLAFFVTLAM